MYTRKEQMEKVKHLDRKVDAISANMETKVDEFLAENLAEVVQFNHVVLETMREVFTEKQQEEFFDLMAAKMMESELFKE